MLLTLEELKEKIIQYANENRTYPSGRTVMDKIKGIPNYYNFYKKTYGMSIREIIDSCNIQFEYRHRQFDYSDENITTFYKDFAKEIGHIPSMSEINDRSKLDSDIPSAHTIINRFGSIEKLNELCGLSSTTTKNGKFKEEHLIAELRRFHSEFNKIPSSSDFEKLKSNRYPSRKSFSNHFGTFNNALRAAGFNVQDKPIYTKDFLISEIHRYISEYGKQPYSREIEEAEGYPSSYHFEKLFGSWNHAIEAAGLKIRVSQYTNQQLDDAFMSFVNENGRPPKLHEFNDASKYPSFWCYQNRFGSWNKTLIHYGFEPHEGTSGKWHKLENGEICKSSYEYDVSNWLRENGISYLRNVPYRDFVDNYEGRKDCDYVIIHNGEWIWLEIAGLYSNREKKSSMEKHYVKAFEHKLEHLLSNFNYQIFYPEDFDDYDIDELFDFLWDIPDSPPWDKPEQIFQGVGEDFDEVIEWLQK